MDPATIDPEPKIGFLANLNAMHAQQRIQTGNFDPANYEGVFAMYWTAYGDLELAHRAKSRAAEIYAERMTRGHSR